MRMKAKLAAMIVAAAAAVPGSVLAADGDKAVGSGPNPFSDCGIGAALFPKVDVAAVLSNIIWDLGSTAVTSATASPETCTGKEVKAAAFIMDGIEDLQLETAAGEGAHLAALMNILDVPAEARTDVLTSVRKDMAAAVAAPGYADLDARTQASRYYDSVMAAVKAS